MYDLHTPSCSQSLLGTTLYRQSELYDNNCRGVGDISTLDDNSILFNDDLNRNLWLTGTLSESNLFSTFNDNTCSSQNVSTVLPAAEAESKVVDSFETNWWAYNEALYFNVLWQSESVGERSDSFPENDMGAWSSGETVACENVIGFGERQCDLSVF